MVGILGELILATVLGDGAIFVLVSTNNEPTRKAKLNPCALELISLGTIRGGTPREGEPA